MLDYAQDLPFTPILALSIKQPWAWAIVYAGKRVENRTWYTSHRGKILIHSGLSVDREALIDLADVIQAVPQPRPIAHCGGIIATATLRDCVRVNEVQIEQRPWANGPWCFLLDEIEPLTEPIAQKGALGFFGIDPRTELRLASQITK